MIDYDTLTRYISIDVIFYQDIFVLFKPSIFSNNILE